MHITHPFTLSMNSLQSKPGSFGKIELHLTQEHSEVASIIDRLSEDTLVRTLMGNYSGHILSALAAVLRQENLPVVTYAKAARQESIVAVNAAQLLNGGNVVRSLWTVRAKDNEFEGLGRELIEYRNRLLHQMGIAFVETTAATLEGDKLTYDTGGIRERGVFRFGSYYYDLKQLHQEVHAAK